MQNTWSCSSLVLNKNKKTEKNLSEGLKVRLASGLAQAVSFMLGIYAEPPFGSHGWTEIYWEKLYMYIYVYNLCIHLYMYTHRHKTHTHAHTTANNNHYTTHACNRH